MGDHQRRGRVRHAVTASEVVVAVLAVVAGLAVIAVVTWTNHPLTAVGADVAGATASETDRGSLAQGTVADDGRYDTPEPGEIGEGESATGKRPMQSSSRLEERKVNALVDDVEAIVRRSKVRATTFRVASLNILGSNHVGNGLNRAAREAALLRDRGVQIVGMQEVQRDQRSVLINNLPAMQMWPQDALGRDGYRVQIMWRTDRFTMVDNGGSSHTFNGIRSVPIPYVLLRDRTTGAQFWVIVTHNSPNGRQSERNASAEIQIDLVNRLRATGHPVLLMGDLNEKTTVFCKFATRAGMISANGGSGSPSGCRPPGGPQRIDWILGTGGDEVDFSGYVQDGTTRAQGMSDHYLVYADAAVVDKAAP